MSRFGRDSPAPVLARARWWLPVIFLALLALPQPALLGAAALLATGRAVVALTRGRRQAIAAAWRRRRDAARAPGATVLGVEPSGRLVLLGERELSAHGLILGASGAGKSTTLLTILTSHIRRGLPVVAIDLKGSPAFACELELSANAAGRRLRVWSPDGTEQWNPLAHGNATELKDKLIATERFTEPHFQRAAERYVQLALQAMIESDPDHAPTLAGVVSLLEPTRLSALTRALPRVRAEYIRDYLAGLTPDQQSAIRGLASRLAIVTESHTGAFLNQGDDGGIDLRSALSGGDVVLFSLNSSTYGKLAAQLGTLAVQDLVTAVGHRLAGGPPTGRDVSADGRTRAGSAPAQAVVGIDEFSALGSDNVISLLARGRESGVSVLLATQELADLDRAARGLRDQVLGNTALKIAHRQEVPESAQALARMAGNIRRWERSYQVRSGPFGTPDMSRGTLRAVDAHLIEPDQIRTLRTGEAVVITKVPDAATRRVRIALPAAFPTQATPGARATRTSERDGPER